METIYLLLGSYSQGQWILAKNRQQLQGTTFFVDKVILFYVPGNLGIK